jgi:hypothetical protein
MAQNDTRLTPKQLKFLEAYCAGKAVEEAAAAAGIKRRQAHRWLREPAVQAAIREHSRDALRRTTATLEQASGDAAATLVEALAAPLWPVRLKAAELLLDRLLKFHEVLNFEARIAALEQKLAERDNA